MGLFGKKKANEEHIAALRVEVESMRKRLDGTDRLNASLAARLASLDLSATDFEKRFDRVDKLDVRIEELATRAEQTPLLTATPTPPPPPQPELQPEPQREADFETTVIAHRRLTELADQLEQLSITVAAHYTEVSAGKRKMDAVDDLNERFGDIAERVSSIDTRVTNVSVELANQLTELSRDIETMSDRAGSDETTSPAVATDDQINERIDDRVNERVDEQIDGRIDERVNERVGEQIDERVDKRIDERVGEQIDGQIDEHLDSALDDVRDTAERLAAEQARYEMKFHEDLADLADRLRHPDRS